MTSLEISIKKPAAGHITLGPCLFNWPADYWRDFYFKMADIDAIDRIYLGEVVCSKRMPFYQSVLPDVVERLQSSGKEIILSSLGLIMNKREMTMVEELAENDDFMVEANDVSTMSLLKNRPHMIGPYVNIYNEATLDYMAKNGAISASLPVELSFQSIKILAVNKNIDLEVQVFGRLPLALSARCYHARHHGLSKDNCKFVCEKDYDGMDLSTLDDQKFLTINGIQTMSYTYVNLLGELDLLRQAGVNHYRLSPHSCDMAAVAMAFRDMLDGKIDLKQGYAILKNQINDIPFSNGYFYNIEGVKAHDALNLL